MIRTYRTHGPTPLLTLEPRGHVFESATIADGRYLALLEANASTALLTVLQLQKDGHLSQNTLHSVQTIHCAHFVRNSLFVLLGLVLNEYDVLQNTQVRAISVESLISGWRVLGITGENDWHLVCDLKGELDSINFEHPFSFISKSRASIGLLTKVIKKSPFQSLVKVNKFLVMGINDLGAVQLYCAASNSKSQLYHPGFDVKYAACSEFNPFIKEKQQFSVSFLCALANQHKLLIVECTIPLPVHSAHAFPLELCSIRQSSFALQTNFVKRAEWQCSSIQFAFAENSFWYYQKSILCHRNLQNLFSQTLCETELQSPKLIASRDSTIFIRTANQLVLVRSQDSRKREWQPVIQNDRPYGLFDLLPRQSQPMKLYCARAEAEHDQILSRVEQKYSSKRRLALPLISCQVFYSCLLRTRQMLLGLTAENRDSILALSAWIAYIESRQLGSAKPLLEQLRFTQSSSPFPSEAWFRQAQQQSYIAIFKLLDRQFAQSALQKIQDLDDSFFQLYRPIQLSKSLCKSVISGPVLLQAVSGQVAESRLGDLRQRKDSLPQKAAEVVQFFALLLNQQSNFPALMRAHRSLRRIERRQNKLQLLDQMWDIAINHEGNELLEKFVCYLETNEKDIAQHHLTCMLRRVVNHVAQSMGDSPTQTQLSLLHRAILLSQDQNFAALLTAPLHGVALTRVNVQAALQSAKKKIKIQRLYYEHYKEGKYLSALLLAPSGEAVQDIVYNLLEAQNYLTVARASKVKDIREALVLYFLRVKSYSEFYKFIKKLGLAVGWLAFDELFRQSRLDEARKELVRVVTEERLGISKQRLECCTGGLSEEQVRAFMEQVKQRHLRKSRGE